MFLQLISKNTTWPSSDHTFLKSFTSVAFFASITLLFVILSVVPIFLPLSFFFVLKIVLRFKKIISIDICWEHWYSASLFGFFNVSSNAYADASRSKKFNPTTAFKKCYRGSKGMHRLITFFLYFFKKCFKNK